MLSPWPQLFDYVLLVPTVLRVVLGVMYIRFGYFKLTRGREVKRTFFNRAGFPAARWWVWGIGILELVGGLFLIVGFLTQITALVLSIILLGAAFIKTRKPDLLPNSTDYYILIFVTTASLLLLGPGFLAVDLPL